MNLIDAVLIVPLLWFAYRGFKKGLVLEVFSLLALFAGIYAAIHFSDFASVILQDNFKITSEYLPLVSFGLTFIAVLILVHLLGKMISGLMKVMALDVVNKILGAVFSMTKMILITGVLLSFFNSANEKIELIPEETKEGSLLYKPILKVTETVLPAIKESKYYEQFEKWRDEKTEESIEKVIES